MEQVIAALRLRSEQTSAPLELPSEEQIEQVQEELLISLPRELRDFLLKVSDVLVGSLEPVTAADPRSHTYLSDVAALAWDRGLPREYLPICEYADGYACMAEDGEVLFWSDGDFTDKVWDNIWVWCREVWLLS